jgi:hypothetical protein
MTLAIGDMVSPEDFLTQRFFNAKTQSAAKIAGQRRRGIIFLPSVCLPEAASELMVVFTVLALS